MYLGQSIEISAPPERVWKIFAGVERWHEWTASITSVTRLDSGSFGVGSRALVLQPQLRPATFEVTEFNPMHNFKWRTSNGGISALANHVVEPTAGGTRLTISIDFNGLPPPAHQLVRTSTHEQVLHSGDRMSKASDRNGNSLGSRTAPMLHKTAERWQ
ncbi:MAG: polyketide cyclase [Dehalococcoidia bacterium]|nr:polyketide cyclase [Dehalococcoidia bacterium]